MAKLGSWCDSGVLKCGKVFPHILDCFGFGFNISLIFHHFCGGSNLWFYTPCHFVIHPSASISPVRQSAVSLSKKKKYEMKWWQFGDGVLSEQSKLTSRKSQYKGKKPACLKHYGLLRFIDRRLEWDLQCDTVLFCSHVYMCGVGKDKFKPRIGFWLSKSE
jgi:hypothetical protein